MQTPSKTYYSPEEYLELETVAEYKSEYHEGQIIRPSVNLHCYRSQLQLITRLLLGSFLRYMQQEN